MSFLAPLFLFGALALTLPILFHLIRRTSRERIQFSSLMFLRPTIPRVTRQSRLENILLLLLRCLILLLLAFGFARPFIQKPILPISQREQAKKIIVLMDTSASMRRENLWDAAKSRAESVLTAAGSSDRVAVAAFDRQVRQLVTFEQWSTMDQADRIPLTIQQLNNVEPGWSSTDFSNALITTAELFDENPDQDHLFGSRQIVLISDLQEGAKWTGLQGYEWPRGVECVVETLPVTQKSNAGFQVVIDTEETLQLSTNEAPRLRVVNSADSGSDQFNVRWVEPSESAPLQVYVPPGSSRVLPAPQLNENAFGEQLVLSGDDADFDNTAYYIPQKAETVPVIYLGSESETDPEQPLYYLKRAFQQTRKHRVNVLQHAVTDELPKSETDAAKLMIVTEALPDSQIERLREYLGEGSTILFVLKSVDAVRTLSVLLNSPTSEANEVETQRYAMLGEISFDHPLFAPFADPRFSDFTKIHFWKYRRLNIDDFPGAKALARFDDGSPAILETSVGNGTLLALTSGWHPSDSELALSSKFVPILYSVLDQAAGLKSHRLQYWVGDKITLSRTNTAQVVTVLRPDGAEVQSDANGVFSESELPGIYTVSSATPSWRFAVNLDPSESKTAPMISEDLERFGVPFPKESPSEDTVRTKEQETQQHATELESQQKLWRWIILAALIALVCETFFAGWVGRKPATAT